METTDVQKPEVSSSNSGHATQSSASKEKTGKKRVHHVQSRYLQVPSSSAKKGTPLTVSSSNSQSLVDKKTPPPIRRTLFKGPPALTAGSGAASLKIKRPPAPSTGPLVALPSSQEYETDNAVGSFSLEPERSRKVNLFPQNLDAEELQLLSSQNIAAKFVCAKAKKSLDALRLDASRKLWLLRELNRDQLMKKSGYEVEINREKFLDLLQGHFNAQKELQHNSTAEMTRFSQRSSEITASLDACLHNLPLRNIHVPRDLDKLRKIIDDLSGSLDLSVSKISGRTLMEECAQQLLETMASLEKEVSTILRLRGDLEEAKVVSGILSYHMVKDLQERMPECNLFQFDF